MSFGEVLTAVDAGLGLMAVFLWLQHGATLRRIARRLGVVESRDTPPPGSLRVITDIKSGPVRERARTAPL